MLYFIEYKKANILQKVSEPIVGDTQCQKYYRDFNSTKHLCAGGTSYNKGVCSGDSGGPLQCKGTDGKYYQVGITSQTYSFYCGVPNEPDLFTKVSEFTDWIHNVINKY